MRPPRNLAGGAPRGLILTCAAVALIALAPVLITVVQALQGGASAAANSLRASSSLTLLGHTALVAFVATPICGVFGVAGAWFVERTRLPARRLWALLLVAPLAVPLFVTSYAYATLGTSLTGFSGSVAIVAFSYYPIVFLLTAASLRVMDPALEETARSLGLGAWRAFWRVVMPQLRPALYGGLLLVLLDALVEFDAFVAFKYQTFTLDIYAQYQLSFSASGAAALSFFSIVLCVLVLIGESRLRGGANYTRISRASRRGTDRYELGRATPAVLVGFGALVTISLGIPVGMLVYWFTQSSSAALSGAAANVQYLWPATLTSVLLGVGSAVVAILFALPVAVLAVRYKGRMGTLLERSVYLSFALPDLVAAIALGLRGQPSGAPPVRQRRAVGAGRGGALPALRGGRSPQHARSARTRTRGHRPLARARAASDLVAGDRPARASGPRRGRSARVRLRPRRSLDRASAPPAVDVHPRDPVRRQQPDGGLCRGRSLRRGAGRPRVARDLRVDEPLRQGPRTRGPLTTWKDRRG